MRAGEKLKFKIAEHYNKRPNYCWANLVMWAFNYRSFWSLFFREHPEFDYDNQGCKSPHTYCGKCQEENKS